MPLGSSSGAKCSRYRISHLRSRHFCSRLIGLVREAVIGRYWVGREADIYWMAFVIPDFLNYLLAGGILSIVLFHFSKATERRLGGTTFPSNLSTAWVIGHWIHCCLWTLTPTLTPLIAPGMDADDLNHFDLLVRIILPAQIFHLTGAVLSAALQAQISIQCPRSRQSFIPSIVLWWRHPGTNIGRRGVCGSWQVP